MNLPDPAKADSVPPTSRGEEPRPLGELTCYGLTNYGRACIRAFCEEVNRRAEKNMLKTGKLEGSHYAAMTELRRELGI